ncbi:Crp/Fnr family transcriptional regulator [Tsuneonella sp. HG222]
MADELVRYPRTGRFLQGRLRNALSPAEKNTLETIVGPDRVFADGEHIATRGELCESSTLLIEGFIARVIVRKGKLHIVGLQVPGDFVDLHAFALKRLDHNVVALGEVRVGQVAHRDLRQVLEQQPHLARLFWFSTLLDAAIHREWVLKLEELNAAQRAAHVFCEIWHRLEMVGLAEKGGFTIPLTQIQLASMCGATPVHMSRALKLLREQDLASFRHGRVHAADRRKLERFCEFDPSYLYGPGELRVESDDFS